MGGRPLGAAIIPRRRRVRRDFIRTEDPSLALTVGFRFFFPLSRYK